jgi:single-strand DNA-binding protein
VSFQTIVIEGNLGKDPELVDGGTDKARAKFSVAVSEKRRGEEATEWFNVICFGKTAENAAQYLTKGNKALVQGRQQSRKYTDKQGVERVFVELVADRVVFLGGRDAAAGAPQRMSGGKQGNGKADPAPEGGFVDDDLPF